MWIKLFIGAMIILAIIFGSSFYFSYLDQSSKADSLDTKIQVNSQALKTLSNKTKDTEAEIVELTQKIQLAQINLSSPKTELPGMTSSNTILRKVMTLGDNNGLRVIPLNTQDWTAQTENNRSYHVLRMSLQLVGPIQDILDFIRNIQDSVDQYLVIEHLSMTNSLNLVSISGSSNDPPYISEISPEEAYTGDFVIITGQNFTGTTKVTFGKEPASLFIVNSDNEIYARVGFGSSGNVHITNNKGTTSLSGFSYLGATPQRAYQTSNVDDTRISLNIAIYAK